MRLKLQWHFGSCRKAVAGKSWQHLRCKLHQTTNDPLHPSLALAIFACTFSLAANSACFSSGPVRRMCRPHLKLGTHWLAHLHICACSFALAHLRLHISACTKQCIFLLRACAPHVPTAPKAGNATARFHICAYTLWLAHLPLHAWACTVYDCTFHTWACTFALAHLALHT